MGVLDEMTKGITQRKAEAAGPRLTPVGTEASPTKPSIPDVPSEFLTNEAVGDMAKVLEDISGRLAVVAVELRDLTGTAKVEVVDTEAATKAAEKAADAKHAIPLTPQAKALTESIAAIKAKAEGSGGWTCPTHGDENVVDLVSGRTKREYRACKVGVCGQFEK